VKNVISEAGDDDKIFIIVETPEDALRLVSNGVDIKKVNIGNMHPGEGKKEVAPTVNVGADDVANFKKLQEAGVELLKGFLQNEGQSEECKL
jgi:PTS system N-acetylgalactosamine-specific IIB component